MTLFDLVEEQTGMWNTQQLISLFGYHKCMLIVTNLQPPIPGRGRDMLIFSKTSNGIFAVKHCYNHIMFKRISTSGLGRGLKATWEALWRKWNIMPRVKLFIWKATHSGLPLAQIISSRTGKGDGRCTLCDMGVEDVSHLFTRCPFERSCWLAALVPVRSDLLPADFYHTMRCLNETCDEEQWGSIANNLWAIWRCRNDFVYAGSIPSHQKWAKFYVAIERESVLRSSNRMISGTVTLVPQVVTREETQAEFICYVDGAWKEAWNGGVGFVIFKNGVLVAYKSAGRKGYSPQQMEAQALLEALNFVIERGITSCDFYSDCASLVTACNQPGPST